MSRVLGARADSAERTAHEPTKLPTVSDDEVADLLARSGTMEAQPVQARVEHDSHLVGHWRHTAPMSSGGFSLVTDTHLVLDEQAVLPVGHIQPAASVKETQGLWRELGNLAKQRWCLRTTMATSPSCCTKSMHGTYCSRTGALRSTGNACAKCQSFRFPKSRFLIT